MRLLETVPMSAFSSSKEPYVLGTFCVTMRLWNRFQLLIPLLFVDLQEDECVSARSRRYP